MKKIPREDLFALVWEKPTVEVAKELGVSDVAVANLCTRLQVPSAQARRTFRYMAKVKILPPSLQHTERT